MSNGAPIEPTSPTWKNWSGNIQHHANHYYFKPRTKAELQSVLARAKSNGVTVRVSGQRHSQPPLVAADNRGETPPSQPKEYLVDMSCYLDVGDKGMELGPGANQVTVNPGVREDDLDAFLTQNNLMLETVTAGGFFSIGGMTAVDVHGATVDAPIFAETASAFTVMGADGREAVIDGESTDQDGNPVLPFLRVSLGAFGVVTRITIDALPRPWANTVQGGMERYKLENQQEFVAQFKQLLNGPNKCARIETFYSPYAAAKNLPVPTMKNFLALWWNVVENPSPEIPNSAPAPKTACELSNEAPPEFGAASLGGLKQYLVKYVRRSQYFANAYNPIHLPPVPPSGYAAIALDEIERQVKAANEKHSDLWLAASIRVMFMSYFVELPGLDEAGLGKVWEGLQVAGDYVIEDDHFHIAAPMEFRFIKAGDAAMSGTFSQNRDAYFVNFDLIGFTEATTGAEYPKELLEFFAFVERKWVDMGGLPHHGKMYGFYDPTDGDASSYTPPFNKNFLSFITQQRSKKGAPVEAFRQYRQACDPDGRFYNQYLRDLLA